MKPCRTPNFIDTSRTAEIALTDNKYLLKPFVWVLQYIQIIIKHPILQVRCQKIKEKQSIILSDIHIHTKTDFSRAFL